MVVVVDGPQGREVTGLHGGQEVLPPAPLQVHETPQTLLSVSLDHPQAVRNEGLVEDPLEERRTGLCIISLDRKHTDSLQTNTTAQRSTELAEFGGINSLVDGHQCCQQVMCGPSLSCTTGTCSISDHLLEQFSNHGASVKVHLVFVALRIKVPAVVLYL